MERLEYKRIQNRMIINKISFQSIMTHAGGKAPHPLTPWFEVLHNEKANKNNKKALCLSCIRYVGRDFLLKDENNKITNTQRYCYKHLQTCQNFLTEHGLNEVNRILALSKFNTTTITKKRQFIGNFKLKFYLINVKKIKLIYLFILIRN